MAKNVDRLTSIAVKNLKVAGWHHDGGGLYLKIADTGSTSWVFSFKRGKREDGSARVYNMGLGAYSERKPGVTLAAARDKAVEARAMLAKGTNPMEEKAGAAALQHGDAGDDSGHAAGPDCPWLSFDLPRLGSRGDIIPARIGRGGSCSYCRLCG